MVNEDEDYQNYDPGYPPNFGYDQTTHQIPQNMYQSNAGPNYPQQQMNRYSHAEGPYKAPNMQPTEKELAGYSEQIMSSQGIPQYFNQQPPIYQNMLGSTSHENLNLKSMHFDPKASLYGPNMGSVNFPLGMMYPPHLQNSQHLYAANTFGNDPNMSMYAPRPQELPNEVYAQNDIYGSKPNEAEFLNEKLNKVQQMYDTLKKEYDEQKKFYDEALEARTNQLEEAENELTTTKGELELAKKIEIDLKSKNESMAFDNEMLQKRIEATGMDKTNASQREEGLLKQLDELNTALKQKESIIEQKVDENFGLKQTIDGLRNEADKARKRIDALEDMLRGKDGHIQDMDREIGGLKGEVSALKAKEAGLLRDNENMSNELNNLRGLLKAEKEKSELMLRDIHGFKNELGQSELREQSSRNALENAKKELESVKSQLSQANSYIQTQDNQFRNLQRDLDHQKSTNIDLKTQLEAAKLQATFTQQMQYQAPATPYRPPPPQYDSYQHYQPPPPQFTYAPQEPAYPSPPSYAPSSPPKRQEYSPKDQYSPPRDDYKPTRNYEEVHRQESRESYSTKSEQNYPTRASHHQSSMGTLLTWENKGLETRAQPPPAVRKEPSRQTSEWDDREDVKQEQAYAPPPRHNQRSGQEQPTQWQVHFLLIPLGSKHLLHLRIVK